MGKSKKKKTADATVLKAYVKRRQLTKILTIVFGALFFVSCIVLGVSNMAHWLIWTLLALYIISLVSLRICSRCPYCGRSIMRSFNRSTHCPYCRRPIKPNAGLKAPGTLK